MINISTNRQDKHMINPNYRGLTPGCYNHTPLNESRPEIQNQRLLTRKEQNYHQRRQETVTLEKVDVVGRSRCG